MKILIISELFSPRGGSEIIAYSTYKILKNKGHEVYFFATDKKPFWENYEYSKYFTKYNGGIKNYIKNPLKYYYNIQAKKDLNKFIELIKPDCIHIHVYSGLSPSIFDCLKNIPTVFSLHDANLCCPAFALLNKNGCICQKEVNSNFIPCLINRCVNNSLEASLRRSILFKLFHSKLKYVDKFITPSNALKELMIQTKIGINPENIVTINNFLSKHEFGNVKPNYNNKGYFLFVGRLSKEKGVHYLLEAMKDLPKDIKLHIVGIGSEEEKLKKYAKENNLNNVKFCGFKNREEIKEEYQNCITLIVPSNCFETFGIINIEAAINGKPAIASNIGGIPEIVEHNKTGLLFEPANVEELKECILKYWNNSNLVIEHGKNAYEKATKLYTEERYYKELIQVYNEVLNEK